MPTSSPSILFLLSSSSIVVIFVLLAMTIIFTVSAEEQPMQPEKDQDDQNKEQEQEQQQEEDPNRFTSILREAYESDYDAADIEVFDQNGIPELRVLKEIQPLEQSGVRLMKFGGSFQAAVPLTTPPRYGVDTNESLQPIQPVDWSARCPLRYFSTMSQAIPFYELRAQRYNRLQKAKAKNNNNKNQNDEVSSASDEKASVPASVENILLVGLGAGTAIKQFEKLVPNQKFKRADVVELEPAVIEIAEKYFNIKNGTDVTNIFEGDGFEVLDRDENKFNKDMVYDVIVVDCASSGATYNEDPLYPLRIKELPNPPDISQPLSCFKPRFLKLLINFYLRKKETSVVVTNYVGFVEPAGYLFQKPLLRVLKTFKNSFQREARPIFVPSFLRKWKDGFRSTEAGHRNAKHFDNHAIFGTWQDTYEPSIDEMVKHVKKTLKERFSKIAEENLYLDLVKNRYEREMEEMQDEVVVLPRTEKKKPQVKVKELPDNYVPLEDREADEKLKKHMKGSIWHDY